MRMGIQGAAAAFCGLLAMCGWSLAQQPRTNDRVAPAELPDREASKMDRAAAEMAAAAHNFWAALTHEQQAKATFPFEGDERYNWPFIPRARKGITWNDLTSAQQALGHAFLASGLSSRGYQKAVTIMSLDQILKEME